MHHFFRAFALAVVGGGAALLSSCNIAELLSPCRVSVPTGGTDAQRSIEDIDGAWFLRSVDGQMIPIGGYPLPGSQKRLMNGVLRFVSTERYWSDDCKTLLRSEGITTGLYVIRENGVDKRGQRDGAFERNLQDFTSSLSANGYTLPMDVGTFTNGYPTRITLRVPLPLGPLTVTYVLEFRRSAGS